jgi:hypothetical protein
MNRNRSICRFLAGATTGPRGLWRRHARMADMGAMHESCTWTDLKTESALGSSTLSNGSRAP